MDIFDLWKQLPNLDIQTPTAEPEQIEQQQEEKVPLIVDIEESAAYILEIWIIGSSAEVIDEPTKHEPLLPQIKRMVDDNEIVTLHEVDTI